MRPGETGVLLSVDYGTSNTVAVLRWPDGRVRPLLFDGSPLLPSAVYRNPAGELVAGRDAVHSARLDPARYEPNPKLRIDDGVVLLGDAEVPVVELVAATLRLVAAEARRTAGAAPEAVTMTYPAAWAAPRRGVLREAAAMAGLGTPRLVPEPVAAAAYFTAVLGHRLAPGQHLVVYDLGAGTFDVSAVQRTADGYQVVDVDGLPTFGGLDLDAVVVQRVGAAVAATEPEAWRRLTNPQQANDRRAFRALWDDARAAKEMLSRHSAAGLFIPLVERDVQVSREEFEAEARPRLKKAALLTAALIARCGIRPDQLAGIFLVGGSSRVPLAATTVHRATKVAPDTLEQPETVVAEGALHAVSRPFAAPQPDDRPDTSHTASSDAPQQPDVDHPPYDPFPPYEPLPPYQPQQPGPRDPRPASEPRPTPWLAWVLLASAPVVAVVAWLATLTSEISEEKGIAVGLVPVLALSTMAAVSLVRSWRGSAPGTSAPAHRRDVVVAGAVMLVLFGTVASYAVGSLAAMVLLGYDLSWYNLALGPRIAMVLVLPTTAASGAAIWVIHCGTRPAPPRELTPAEARPTLWPAWMLLACSPFAGVVASLMELFTDLPFALGLAIVAAVVVTATVKVVRRLLDQRPAPRKRGLIIAGAVLLVPSGTAASHEFGPLALSPVLIDMGAIAEPPVLTFLLFATLTAAAIGIIRLGLEPDRHSHPLSRTVPPTPTSASTHVETTPRST